MCASIPEPLVCVKEGRYIGNTATPGAEENRSGERVKVVHVATKFAQIMRIFHIDNNTLHIFARRASGELPLRQRGYFSVESRKINQLG